MAASHRFTFDHKRSSARPMHLYQGGSDASLSRARSIMRLEGDGGQGEPPIMPITLHLSRLGSRISRWLIEEKADAYHRITPA